MHFSPPRLHPPVVTTSQQRDLAQRRIAELAAARITLKAVATAVPGPITIPLSTVSMLGTFDARVEVQFSNGNNPPIKTSLIVDSGNTTMIVPNGEDFAGVPGYTVLGSSATEPWGCPANVLKGPLQLVATDGSTHVIPDCVFYACTANNSSGERTANFGTGVTSPWSVNSSNTPGLGVTIRSPLAYDPSISCVQFAYAPVATMFSMASTLVVDDQSVMVLHPAVPAGYTMLNIIPNLEWMSVVPTSLSVGGTVTGWPGTGQSPIAMVDTGGGPVFLSDPLGFVHSKTWPNPVLCPQYPMKSQNCTCTSDRLQVTLVESGGATSFSYGIDTSKMPPSVQGLTAIMCEVNAYMRGEPGMNIGGITALFNNVLIDYGAARVGFSPKGV